MIKILKIILNTISSLYEMVHEHYMWISEYESDEYETTSFLDLKFS